jgi:hypothetical protein
MEEQTMQLQKENKRRKRQKIVDKTRHRLSPWTIVSENKHYKNPTKRVGLVQSRLHHFIEMQLFSRHDIAV